MSSISSHKIFNRCRDCGLEGLTDSYVATVSRVHTAAGLLNPCSSEAVRLGLKKMGRETSSRQNQTHPLGWKDIKEFIESAGEGLRADRERAMLCVAYETLARRSELVALEDIDFHPDGTGQALIPRGKTDAEGQVEWPTYRVKQCVG